MQNNITITDNHEYLVNNVKRPGVNEILKAEGFIKHFNNDEFYLTRGQYVHHACALLDKKTLDWKTLDLELKPYVLAWQKFITDYKVDYLHSEIEVMMYSKVWGFVGTPDRLPKDIKGKATLIDIKTGDFQPWYELTTAAYQILCEENKLKVKQRWIVKLQDTEQYKIIPCEDKKARSVFLGAILGYVWKRENL